jgi:hypothetical protein
MRKDRRQLCRTGTCGALMKGSLRTEQFLQPLMSQADGLRTAGESATYSFWAQLIIHGHYW